MQMYVKTSCASSRKARAYFLTEGIEHEYIQLHKEGITKEVVQHILSLTENGVDDVLKRNLLSEYEDMTFTQFVEKVVEKPTILKTPIILDGDKLLIGYNDDDIRSFLPREEKRKEMEKLLLAI